MTNIYKDLVKLTITKDEKAELALIVLLENMLECSQRQVCKTLDCPWEEYQRLRKKYARVLERWKKEKGRKS